MDDLWLDMNEWMFFSNSLLVPIESMYVPTCTILNHKNQPNVGKYTSPMDSIWYK